MEKVGLFFWKLWESFLTDLSLAEQALAFFAVFVPACGVFGYFRNYYLGLNKNIAIELASEKQSAASWLKKYNETHDKLLAVLKELPENWSQEMIKERKDGNESRAIGKLRDRFRNAAPSLASYADELARYHLSAADEKDSGHIGEAQRWYRIAVLLEGNSSERSRALTEINEILGMISGAKSIDLDSWDDIYDAFPTGADALECISVLNSATVRNLDEGFYQVAYRLNLRALLVAKGHAQPEDPEVLAARYLKAQTLNDLGQSLEVIEEIDSIISLHENVLGSEHPDFLRTRYLKAATLNNLDRSIEALEEIEAFAPIQERVLGSEHPNFLGTRYLKAETLNNLDRSIEALEEVEALMPIREHVLGSEHPNFLATRYLKALILNDLGRSVEALEEIEALMPIREHVLGPEHLNVLATRHLKARALNDLGRSVEALAEIEAVIPIQERVLGSEHPNVKASQQLREILLEC